MRRNVLFLLVVAGMTGCWPTWDPNSMDGSTTLDVQPTAPVACVYEGLIEVCMTSCGARGLRGCVRSDGGLQYSECQTAFMCPADASADSANDATADAANDATADAGPDLPQGTVCNPPTDGVRHCTTETTCQEVIQICDPTLRQWGACGSFGPNMCAVDAGAEAGTDVVTLACTPTTVSGCVACGNSGTRVCGWDGLAWNWSPCSATCADGSTDALDATSDSSADAADVISTDATDSATDTTSTDANDVMSLVDATPDVTADTGSDTSTPDAPDSAIADAGNGCPCVDPWAFRGCVITCGTGINTTLILGAQTCAMFCRNDVCLSINPLPPACFPQDGGADTGTDSGSVDTGADVPKDTGPDVIATDVVDAATDSGSDVATDTGPDAAADVIDASADTSTDTGVDTGTDSGPDVRDTGTDTGPDVIDAGSDSGPDVVDVATDRGPDVADTSTDTSTDTGPDVFDAGTDTGPDVVDTGVDTGFDAGTDVIATDVVDVAVDTRIDSGSVDTGTADTGTPDVGSDAGIVPVIIPPGTLTVVGPAPSVVAPPNGTPLVLWNDSTHFLAVTSYQDCMNGVRPRPSVIPAGTRLYTHCYSTPTPANTSHGNATQVAQHATAWQYSDFSYQFTSLPDLVDVRAPSGAAVGWGFGWTVLLHTEEWGQIKNFYAVAVEGANAWLFYAGSLRPGAMSTRQGTLSISEFISGVEIGRNQDRLIGDTVNCTGGASYLPGGTPPTGYLESKLASWIFCP